MKFFTLIPITLFTLLSTKVDAYWKPKPGLKWNWALGTKVSEIPIENTSYDVIDVDLYGVTKEIITKMHNNGKKVICYFSAGTYEVARKEAEGMLKVKNLVRNKMEGWNEYWLDFRVEEIKAFMSERLDIAKSKGCDGIEFDNVDTVYNVNWSDALTVEDQLKYDKWLANEAHSRNMAAGFKNSIELLEDLKGIFDFAINEECNEYGECDDYSVFLNNNLAVFVALYGYTTDKSFMETVCKETKGLDGLSIIIKDPSESLQYDYTEFNYQKFCGSSSSKATTTTKKTTTTTVKKVTTTTVTKKQTTTTTKKSTTTTKKTTKKTTTTTKKTTTTTKKATTKKVTTKKSTKCTVYVKKVTKKVNNKKTVQTTTTKKCN
eukprot:jgi/Orpsp1_1/1175073/evm.model.c7180000052528.1